MPQFDITSFYPQITFFAGIFLTLHVSIAKNILPKISQNLKLNKRIGAMLDRFAIKGLERDIGVLSLIYNPSSIVSHLIYKESLCLIFLNVFVRLVTNTLISSLN